MFSIVALLITSGAALAEEAAPTTRTARVESFSPQGVVQGVREVANAPPERVLGAGIGGEPGSEPA